MEIIANQPPRKYAGYLIRLLATAIDGLVFFIAVILLAFLLLRGVETAQQLLNDALIFLALTILLLGIGDTALYTPFALSRFGATLGKYLVGLEVVGEDGEKLSFKRAFFRSTTGYLLSSLLWSAGFFWIIKDERKQGWHDKATGSLVVKKRGGGFLAGIAALIILLGISALAASATAKELTKKDQLKRELIFLLLTTRREEKEGKEADQPDGEQENLKLKRVNLKENDGAKEREEINQAMGKT